VHDFLAVCPERRDLLDVSRFPEEIEQRAVALVESNPESKVMLHELCRVDANVVQLPGLQLLKYRAPRFLSNECPSARSTERAVVLRFALHLFRSEWLQELGLHRNHAARRLGKEIEMRKMSRTQAVVAPILELRTRKSDTAVQSQVSRLMAERAERVYGQGGGRMGRTKLRGHDYAALVLPI
jgi:hypothetical protein